MYVPLRLAFPVVSFAFAALCTRISGRLKKMPVLFPPSVHFSAAESQAVPLVVAVTVQYAISALYSSANALVAQSFAFSFKYQLPTGVRSVPLS